MVSFHSGSIRHDKLICEAYLYHYIEEGLENLDSDDIYYNPYSYVIRHFFALTAWVIDSETGAPVNIQRISLLMKTPTYFFPSRDIASDSRMSQLNTHRFILPFWSCDNVSEEEITGEAYFEFEDGTRAEIKGLRLKKPILRDFLVAVPKYPPAWALILQARPFNANLGRETFFDSEPSQEEEIDIPNIPLQR